MGVWRHFHRGSNFWILTLFGSGYAGLGILPAAAQCPVQFHYRKQLVFPQLGERQFTRKLVALGIQNLQISIESAPVAESR
jgi:hypothetical protein